MRRWFCLSTALLIFLLSACAREEKGLFFYYRDALDSEGRTPFGTPFGVVGYERRDVNPATFDELFSLYFSTPVNQSLESPFPKGLTCLSVTLDERVLTVTLSNEFDTLSGIDRTIACACLVQTVTQFSGVDGVRLLTEGDGMKNVPILLPKDFVLEDLGAVNTETTVHLYFSDNNGRYLVSSEQKHYFADEAQIPAYVIGQLIEGPTEEGQLAVIPEGATLRGVSVEENGLCTVDFSSEFLLNRPTTELMERMTIMSIVDSLTELPQIRQVRFLVEGEPVGVFSFMDLGRDYVRDESAIDKVRTGLNETDATLYVRCWSHERLAQIPVRIRQTSQTSLPEALLQRLIDFPTVNDLSSPLPEKTIIQSLDVKDGLCRVDLSRNVRFIAGDEAEERRIVQSIVCTLTSLEEVNAVRLTVNGSSQVFVRYPLDRIYTAEDWL